MSAILDAESPLARAKSKVTVSDLWRALGVAGEPPRPGSGKARVPWREDRNPSFGVTPDGMGWRDWGRGADDRGDAVDFIVRYSNVSAGDAARRLIDIAGTMGTAAPRRHNRRASVERPRPIWPTFEIGTRAELRVVADLRSLSVEGVTLASERGLLRFADTRHGRAWIVTDSSGRNAQARRMDGGTWAHIGGAKAWTLPGAEASWPVGLAESAPFDSVAIVEGGPDLLAAFHHAWCSGVEDRVGVVGILGAGMGIPAQASEMLRGKRVRVFPHNDPDGGGYRACVRWGRGLAEIAHSMDAFDLSGLRKNDALPVKDLNDLARVCADDWEEQRALIDGALDF